MKSGFPATIFRRSLLYLFMLPVLVLSLSACEESAAELDHSAGALNLYKARCISCHGNELQGKMGPSTNLQYIGRRLNEKEIIQQIHDGGAIMPAFANKLTPNQIKQLAEWLAKKK